jgi:hypothetical protein
VRALRTLIIPAEEERTAQHAHDFSLANNNTDK